MPRKSPWLDLIENRAYTRLRDLRSRGLWNGQPPIPVDFVIEHLLDLRISWEDVEEKEGEVILACLRAETRELVLNERHKEAFTRNPGLERFSKGHETGHADIFALGGESEQLTLLGRSYVPQRRSAANGQVVVIPQLRKLPPDLRAGVFEAAAANERARRASGEDSAIVRRAVDHYAAVLLMPGDIVRSRVAGRDLSVPGTVTVMAREFVVSGAAMRIRLQELGLLLGVDAPGRSAVPGLAQEQPTLF